MGQVCLLKHDTIYIQADVNRLAHQSGSAWILLTFQDHISNKIINILFLFF